jgi:hypothetical protein
VYSWTVLENPEFPDATLPKDMKRAIMDKYTVGDVIVHPRIAYADGAMTTQRLVMVFFSNTNTATVTVKALTLTVNEVILEYGDRFIDASVSDWKSYQVNKPFYVCGIHGDPIDHPKAELIKNKVKLSLTISVKDKSGKAAEKTIEADFLPKKRSYME